MRRSLMGRAIVRASICLAAILLLPSSAASVPQGGQSRSARITRDSAIYGIAKRTGQSPNEAQVGWRGNRQSQVAL